MIFVTELDKLLTNVISRAPGENQPRSIGKPLPDSLHKVFSKLGEHRLTQYYNKLAPTLVTQTGAFTRFALAHQNGLIWAFDPATGDNPKVYQGQIGDAKIEWYEEPERMESFLITFLYWNAANGGANFSLIGEVSKASKRRLVGATKAWSCPDFSVQEANECLFIITGNTIYVFGINKSAIQNFVRDFKLIVNESGNCFEK
jgi:hypothetical protein